MKTVHTEIEIYAPATRIWRHLTDFSSYAQWNPFITSAEGDLRAGGRLKITAALPDARPMTFRPVVTRFEPIVELRWLGRLGGMPLLFEGEHSFRLEAVREDATRFVQAESFRGVLVPLVFRSMSRSTTSGFERMNHALKRISENG